LTPVATVDEGNNWINLRWGPLSLLNPVTNVVLANYGPASSSSVIGLIPNGTAEYIAAPALDFYGNARKTNKSVDAGAVEYVAPAIAIVSVTGGPLAFGNVAQGTTSAAETLTLHNTGGADFTGAAVAVTLPFSQGTGSTCTATLAAGSTCTINIVFAPTASGAATGTATITGGNAAVTGSPVALSGTGVAAATVSISPNPLMITLARVTGNNTGTVTLKNTSTGASTTISGVVVAGGDMATGWFFNKLGGGNDTCTNRTLAPAATCTVAVRFTNMTAAKGSYSGTITFTDNASGSPQSGGLTGVVP
jgi:hypothetical protein